MGIGQATENVGQRREAIALVAVLGGEQGVAADYSVKSGITANERHGVAEKLRQIAAQVESS